MQLTDAETRDRERFYELLLAPGFGLHMAEPSEPQRDVYRHEWLVWTVQEALKMPLPGLSRCSTHNESGWFTLSADGNARYAADLACTNMPPTFVAQYKERLNATWVLSTGLDTPQANRLLAEAVGRSVRGFSGTFHSVTLPPDPSRRQRRFIEGSAHIYDTGELAASVGVVLP